MSLLPVSPLSVRGPNTPGAKRRRLGKRWFAVARAGWVGVTGLCLALFVVAVPVRFTQLDTPPEPVILALRHLNLSVYFYASYNLLCEICLVAGFLTVAAVLCWRSWGKLNEWMALSAAFFLVAFGTDTPTIYALVAKGVGCALLVRKLAGGWAAICTTVWAIRLPACCAA